MAVRIGTQMTEVMYRVLQKDGLNWTVNGA